MTKSDKASARVIHEHGPSGFVLFIAFIGAAVYFMGQAQGFWEGVLALLKAIVWPGFVVYHGLQLLGV